MAFLSASGAKHPIEEVHRWVGAEDLAVASVTPVSVIGVVAPDGVGA